MVHLQYNQTNFLANSHFMRLKFKKKTVDKHSCRVAYKTGEKEREREKKEHLNQKPVLSILAISSQRFFFVDIAFILFKIKRWI